ncbi:hypothetical protein A3C91_02485 [Candidatus Azambacteria bacterium RIFCSPHIGHO2_02_FULL_52_12]|uniref:GGDEF domain-containing protein n=1 Tax=Candidatus Azambacteria bacterium RIFCSPLOWO2_01_FULL_46_25 TaxID=1797298 RepID=A0A1F5BVT6_9BACT|nr:MAG: hypothetical protein A3C91_02485 [Candidatus Azambacteria bacterium RIFCSPHIGHO2_02_FULL_52_12]OGD34688.1 MAG: hypothetical protein A2988_04280 [Candidatus Azambacteria bacterium RIFCSPLOWO2_01_FULL_46_25]OGD37458.1 MAG: hypothetical protein A2850_02710 [Candidatus Azambacteria bacterium RIFCSPHIGHO2_01_FULL_51_74]
MKEELRKLKDEIKRLRELAYKDELTALYNRRGFSEEAKKFLKEIVVFKKDPERRESFSIKNFSIIVFDIDNFKKFNDAYGHQAGDEVLKKVSRIMQDSVRDIDLAARWGGEEMVLGLVGANENDAFNIADSIRKRVMHTDLVWKRKKLHVTVSGGVAGFDKVDTFDDLFRLADKALYKAKQDGRNMVVRSQDLGKRKKV